MFGKGYIVDYCISLFTKEQKEQSLIYYVTNCLQMITENTAMAVGGKYMTMNYSDLFKEQDNRTAEEIVDDVLEKCGLGG